MKIIISDKKIVNKSLYSFTPNYDYVFVSVTDDFSENNEFKVTEKNTDKLINYLSYSWDGEIYWFSDKFKDNVLSELKEWFKNESNHEDSDDFDIYNCFLIKETPNGLALIDTQTDMSSTIESFLEVIKEKIPEIEYFKYSDCHLIDHLYLGRNMVNNEFEEFYFMYKEKIIDNSFFLKGFDYKEYRDLLDKSKNIVLTGTFDLEREYIVDTLKRNGYSIKDKIDVDSWLWIGNKPGNNKIKEAKEKNIKMSTIDELIDMSFENYMNKKKLKNKI